MRVLEKRERQTFTLKKKKERKFLYNQEKKIVIALKHPTSREKS